MNKNNSFKISFVGDIMCEMPLMKASKKSADKYDFSKVFSNISNKFSQSDIVVGNLETVFAGKEKKYTNDIYSFNTPDDFAVALAESGIKYVTCANNHCLDRGIEGLVRTMDILDDVGVKYFGVSRNIKQREKYTPINCCNGSIALLGYTYNTNIAETKLVLKDEQWYFVNLLQSQKETWNALNQRINKKGYRHFLSRCIRKKLNDYQIAKIKKMFGIYKKNSYIDYIENANISEVNLNRMCEEIREAKDKNDSVIVCLHSGGQFNTKVGSFTEYIVEKIKDAGADVVIAHHPHIVQKCNIDKDFFVAYSLGNFSISPSSIYVIKDNLPQYSIMIHLYYNISDKMTLSKISFSILKIVEENDCNLTVLPAFELYNDTDTEQKNEIYNDCKKIYEMFTGNKYDDFQIKDEYVL